MAIAKKPQRSTDARDEQAAVAFIEGAESKRRDKQERERKTPVMVRFDTELLAEVDAAARRRGVSRSAWIQYTLSRALEAGEG